MILHDDLGIASLLYTPLNDITGIKSEPFRATYYGFVYVNVDFLSRELYRTLKIMNAT